ncbi:MAG TPA: hypothetical protein DCQ45_03770 [Erysipelotrichaceae bacterium]|jgi:TPR repeat protein|nr:hypothetical protein [Erysipelotrichaceae bacterium]
MSKKKIRKPKKKMPLKGGRLPKILISDQETGEKINVSKLLRRYDELTDIKDLNYIYQAYHRESSPLYNPDEALRVLKRMAELGDVHSYVLLGAELFDQDQEDEALPYLQKGIEANDPTANFYYGRYLSLQRDYKKAMVYYEKASAQGEANASLSAYRLAYHNKDVHDPKKAQKYFNLAFAQGQAVAKELAWEFNLKSPLDHRDEKVALQALEDDIIRSKEGADRELNYTYVATEMTEKQLFNLLGKFDLSQLHVEHHLAECYLFGIGTDPDPYRALYYFAKMPYDHLINMMLKYLDPEDPLGSMMKASKKSKACCYYAGKMLMRGSYGEPDLPLAIQTLKRGISKSYPAVQYALAHIYLWSEEYKDIAEARALLEGKTYCRYGNDLERYRDLYTMYKYGIGVEIDEEKAEMYARRSEIVDLLYGGIYL